MKNATLILSVLLAGVAVCGCSESLPNDDPRASAANTSKFQHMKLQPGNSTAPGNTPAPAAAP